MPLLCREYECKVLRQLLGGDRIETGDPKPPSVIFVQGGPQTGKKSLVQNVLKGIQGNNSYRSNIEKKLHIRTALLSCHLGSISSSAIFEELWRQISSQAVKQPGNVEVLLCNYRKRYRFCYRERQF